ncbi:MAG: dockerin type I domain-containing protein, partial [Planctomycetota bacterium]
TNGITEVLATGKHTIQNENFNISGLLDVIDISSECIEVEGNFMVSVSLVNANLSSFPAALDVTNPKGRSFYSKSDDPSDYAKGSLADTAGFRGNWLIRATGTPRVIRGDVNLDGTISLTDVRPFAELLAAGDFQEEADINKDGSVNLLDVPLLVELLERL